MFNIGRQTSWELPRNASLGSNPLDFTAVAQNQESPLSCCHSFVETNATGRFPPTAHQDPFGKEAFCQIMASNRQKVSNNTDRLLNGCVLVAALSNFRSPKCGNKFQIVLN
jgi:hypothetical protein